MENIVIAYDIPVDKRRNKIASVLKDYGVRVQYSVFECKLRPEDFLKLKNALEKIVNKKEDRLYFYKLCEECYKKIVRKGSVQPIIDEEVLIV